MRPKSLWLDRPRSPSSDRIKSGSHFDVAVVGAGLTGLTTALLLARAGRRVAVLEARTAGAVTTGNTTAKVSLLQGTKLSRIRRRHGEDSVRAYVDANRDGQQWLLGYCRERSIRVDIETAYSYAVSAHGAESLVAEFEAAADVGLSPRWDTADELPFGITGAIALDGQAQFDPLDVVSALEIELRELGVPVVEETRVRNVGRAGGSLTVYADTGRYRADRVVLATGTPVLDRGGFFARLEPERSYCVAFSGVEAPPRGMYLAVDSPTRSLRYAPTAAGDLLIVGGNGHTVGRGGPTRPRIDDLVDWTRRYFPGATVSHVWSAQDYHPADELPVIGGIVPGDDGILVAGGYDKWGMATSVAAGLALTARITGENDRPVDWAAPLDPWTASRAGPSALPAAQINTSVAVHMAKGWAGTVAARGTEPPIEGDGDVRAGLPTPTAVCTVGGRTHRASGVCPHLGGILSWNDAEQTWDCPLHGSRFTADGQVLEGPVTKPLTARERT